MLTISNITAGNKDQIQSVVDANVIPPLVNLLNSAEFDIRKEAAWAISNATSGGTPEQIKFLVSQACIPPLCELLSVADVKIIIVALEALENILKVGDAESKQMGGHNLMANHIADSEGLKKIEDLQQHDNNDIYEKAVECWRRISVTRGRELPEIGSNFALGGPEHAAEGLRLRAGHALFGGFWWFATMDFGVDFGGFGGFKRVRPMESRPPAVVTAVPFERNLREILCASICGPSGACGGGSPGAAREERDDVGVARLVRDAERAPGPVARSRRQV